MKRPVFDENSDDTILDQVREGMKVCDNAGNEIGSVREVFLGAVSDEVNERGGGPATANAPETRDETVIDYVARAFADEPMPDVLRDRLLRHGFIRIDTHGLFASDRFALPDQIEAVSEDCIQLRLSKDELIER